MSGGTTATIGRANRARTRAVLFRTLLACFIVAPLLVPVSVYAGADYAREKRWNDEVAPDIVVGDAVYLKQKNGHKFLGIYTEAVNARMGVVLVHGIGVHPDWGIIGTLRKRLPEHGYTTLSIQMPVLAAAAAPDAYAAIFPDAIERLRLAFAYLKSEGYQRIAIVSHSMGSRMTYAYLAGNRVGISAWVALGMSGAASAYAGIDAPVLDLYGANDLPQVLAGSAKRLASLAPNAALKQVRIANANHFFADHENEMIGAVENFLDSLN